MPTIAKRYAEVPIEDLGLKHRTYKLFCSMGVRTVGDLIALPEEILRPHMTILLEGIERVKRDHVPPTQQ